MIAPICFLIARHRAQRAAERARAEVELQAHIEALRPYACEVCGALTMPPEAGDTLCPAHFVPVIKRAAA